MHQKEMSKTLVVSIASVQNSKGKMSNKTSSIALVSDIHLEFGACELTPTKADTLILAGDIVVAVRFKDENLDFFKKACDEYKNVIYIMGNHEHYGSEFKNTQEILRRKLASLRNLHFLDNESVTIDDIMFIGSTLWTSCNDRDPNVLNYVDNGLSDYQVIRDNPVRRFTSRNAAQVNFDSFIYLSCNVEINKDKKIVVVTHHTPSFNSVHPKYGNDTLNYGFSNQYDQFITANPHIKLWVHGHTHDAFDYVIGETRVVCNPRGYYAVEHRRVQFDPKVMEV